ncbi:MAG: GrpB family protein [Alphaproteobacteria bacterium]
MADPLPHPVRIANPDPEWAATARRHSALIRAFAYPLVRRVEHFGSTAVPGLAAKPVIDLMPIIERADLLDSLRPALEALGYQWHGDFGIKGRRFCTLENGGKRLVHVHIYAQDSDQIPPHLIFRDYLRARPDRAAAYEAEKRRAAALHPDDSLAYNGEKADWLQQEMKMATDWADKTGWTLA